ncbi:MAG: GTP-binding protein [Acetobacteraceae bacterium]
MIPVSIVTGFLGSGKTTLIARLLRDPAFGRTAIIVNEFGEVGLDHDLIASSNETFTTLTTGCLCCAVRSDLVETLLELAARRSAGSAAYDRVLVETSGLADPAPILHALMTDAAVMVDHVIDTVATVTDPLFGEATLDRHPEARRQAALADLLIISKTDISPAADTLIGRLDALNPTARRTTSHAVTPAMLFAGGDATMRADRMTRLPDRRPTAPFAAARHTDDIMTFTLLRDRPLPALALTLLLQALAEHCGPRLLRVKGLLAIEEMPGRPALVHGVQHVFAPPDFLPAWPTEDRTSRLVFIARGVPRHFPSRLLAAIEAEVREELSASRP